MCSSTVEYHYIISAFVLASGHPGLEGRTLPYCTLHSAAVRYPEAQPLVEDARK